MRIALLGVSPTVNRLVDAVIGLGEASIDRLCLAAEEEVDSDLVGEITRKTGLSPTQQWESLLLSDIDVVVASPAAGSTQSLREEQLRKLLQAGKRVWAIHPLCDSIVAYELDMIAQEGGEPIRVFEPLVEHPAMAQLSEALKLGERGPLGETETIRWERRIPDRSPQAARQQLARDALVASLLAGDIQVVSGVGRIAAGSDQRVLVGAMLQCGNHRLVQWSNSPGPAGATLSLQGSRGSLELEIPAQGPWRMRFQSSTDQDAALEAASDPHASPDLTVRVLPNPPMSLPSWWSQVAVPQGYLFAEGADDLRSTVADWSHPDQKQSVAAQRRWRQAMRSLEAAELAQNSAARGKALPLHRDQVTETDAFKGVMSAWGCGLLLLTLLALLGFSLFEGVRYSQSKARWLRSRDATQPTSASPPMLERAPLWWRMWPAYPFVAFLLLQILRVLCRSAPPPDPIDKVDAS